MSFCLFRRRHPFPGSHPPSIISAGKLNYCVRYGNRCDLPAIVTRFFSVPWLLPSKCYFRVRSHQHIYLQPLLWIVCFVLKPLKKRKRRLTLCSYFKCLGQALDLLVSVSLICYHTYTSDLSTT